MMMDNEIDTGTSRVGVGKGRDTKHSTTGKCGWDGWIIGTWAILACAKAFAVSLQKKTPKTEPVAPSYPPRYFGKPACCTMVPKHPDTLKTPTLPYVHTPLPPKF